MKTSENGLNIIKTYEGFSAKAYFCPAGKLTIGYGHVIIADEKFPPAGITEKAAENILKQDVMLAEKVINDLVVIELLQNQFDAVVSFVYNIGRKAFEKSKLLRFLNENKPELAAGEFSKWIFAGGTVQNGLVKRRKAEKCLFVADEKEL